MPILNVLNKKVVLANYKFSDKYWPILTELVLEKIGDEEIKDPKFVQNILKECFVKLCSIFEQKISEQRKASFYIFCQNLHEDSIEIWLKTIDGYSLGEIEEDFAGSRRILKIILEQSCKLDLSGTPNFYNEIISNKDSYTEYLEELLYLGSWCFALSEYISKSQLFPDSIGVKIEKNKLNILIYPPYAELYKFVFSEIQKHNKDVALSDSMIGFVTLLKEKFEVDYNILAQFITEQLRNPNYKFGLISLGSMIEDIHTEFRYDKNFITAFYKGLTVNKTNALSIEDCFLKNQDENRHVFRPILELKADDEIYYMIGYYKWLESLTLLTTNSFPFGLYPSEWKKYKVIKTFVNEIDNTHDKLLEDPVNKLLAENSRLFDSNIVSFRQLNGNNINIQNDVGDIDILFLDIKFEIIYVCECKHNRSRFDYSNWKRDYSNFKSKYENQLDRKVNWVKENVEVVEHHLKIKYPEQNILKLKDFRIVGIFIINAPTLYMFNGKYRAFTILDINNLLKEQFVDVKFEFTNESTGKKLLVEYPYFDNLENRLNE